MPIYEYRCEECDHQLEALQRFSDEPLSDCPECDSPTLKKQISAAGFRLKGSGWYETDFKTGNKRNLAGDKKSDSGQKSDNKDGKKSGKTDSKDKKTADKKNNNQSASAA